MVQTKMIGTKTIGPVKPTLEMYFRTILLVLSWLIMGTSGEIIGPTMRILASNIHVTYSGMATVLASRTAGGLLNNIVCGVLQKFVSNNQDLMLTIGFCVPAMIVAATPFIGSLPLMCILFFIHGIAASLANMGGTSLLLKIWDTRAAVPLNLVHFGYGFGAIFANILVRPFLNTMNSPVNTNTSSLPLNSTSSTSSSGSFNADIRVPYLVTAGISLIIGIGHLIFLLRQKTNEKSKIQEKQVDYAPVSTISCKNDLHQDEVKYSQYSPATCGYGYFGYGLSLSIVFTIYIFFVGGTDQTFAKFYFSYLKFDKFGISTYGASWGIILYWLSFSIGRLIGAIESMFIPVHICLAIAWRGGLLLALAWMLYVWILGLTATNLFVLGSLTGLVIGPLYAQSFAWINQKLNTIPILLAALFCGGGLGSLVLQKIGGFVMDRDSNHFPTLITICVFITVSLFILINVIIFFHERRVKSDQEAILNEVKSTNENEEEKQLSKYLQGVNETE